MGFFTNDWRMANAFSDPQVGRPQRITPGAGALSSTQNLNPSQWYPTQFNQPQVQPQDNWGAPVQQQQGFEDPQNMVRFNQFEQPWWWLNRRPTQAQQRGVYNQQGLGSDGGDFGFGSPQGADRSPEGYQDYLSSGRAITQGLTGLLGPMGGLFGLAADYNMGYNTFSPNQGQNLGFTNPFTDDYTPFYNELYQGPGSDEFSNMNPSEQRDMLINQLSYDPYSYDGDDGFLSGLIGNIFGGNQLNYDPDLDLSLLDDDDFDDSDFDDNGFDDDDFGFNDDDFGDSDFDGNGFDDDGFDDSDFGDNGFWD